MPGFGSINTALTALRYARVGMDVASDNVANVATEGYTRRRVESASLDAGAVPAMWFRSTGQGDGVAVTGIGRVTDEVLNVRVRREHGRQSALEVQQAALRRVEDGLAEPGPNGLAAALERLSSSWDTLSHDAGGAAARGAVISAARDVVDTVRNQVRHVGDEMADQRTRALADVTEVQGLVRDLAAANKAIVSGTVNGSDTNALRDSRDLMAVRLASLTGAQTTVQPDGSATVVLGGATLVRGATGATVTIASGVAPDGSDDGGPLRLGVDGPDGSAEVTPGGELGGVAQLLDQTLPAYLSGLASVVASVATAVNTQHRAGYDAAGDAGGDVFSFDPADVLGTLAVAVTDPQRVAAAGVPGPSRDGSNAVALHDLGTLGGAYQQLVTGLGNTAVEVGRQLANQTVLTQQVDMAQQDLGGVSIDEEMVNLTTLQRQYEAAARVMTTVDSLLDTLINRTGLVR